MHDKENNMGVQTKTNRAYDINSAPDVRSKWYERLYQRKQMLEVELEQVKHAINILDTNTNVQDFAAVFTQLEK